MFRLYNQNSFECQTLLALSDTFQQGIARRRHQNKKSQVGMGLSSLDQTIH
jgi:hypothetical protein